MNSIRLTHPLLKCCCILFITLLICLILPSCIKPPEEIPQPVLPIYDTIGNSIDSIGAINYGKLVVLNEGLFQQNNASISQINLLDSSVYNNVYKAINSRNIGDTGNDMQMYGNKIYVVMHSSSYVEVLDKHSLQSIGRVELLNGNSSRLPRYVAFYEGEVWVSCYDGNVVSFDTISYNINSVIKIGRNPEGLSVSGDKLFIANSGGLDTPNYDKTVSVVDLISRKEINKIKVGINPHKVLAAFGKVYVSSRGNYNDILSDTYVIDASSEDLITTLGVQSTSFAVKNDTLIIASYNYNSQKSQVNFYDAISSSLIQMDALNLGNLNTLYAIHTSSDGSIYCCDANSFTTFGHLYLFKNSPNPLKIIDVGLNPTNVLFIQ